MENLSHLTKGPRGPVRISNNNNKKIFIYTDKKDRLVNYIDWLVSIGDQCITSIYTIT
jgi:hypothetical protein